MDPDRPRPILSTLASDTALAPAIDAFVIGLAERVDELQDCEAQGAFARLAERAAKLAVDAAQVGYAPLCACLEDVRRACAERSGENARKAVLELTDLAYRVRLGHRGAA
jgi:hypothetical protein